MRPVSDMDWPKCLQNVVKIFRFKDNAKSAPTLPSLMLKTPSPQWSTVTAASWCWLVFQQHGLGDWSKYKKQWMEQNTKRFLTCWSLSYVWDGNRQSPLRTIHERTMTLNASPEQPPGKYSGLAQSKLRSQFEWDSLVLFKACWILAWRSWSSFCS